MEVKGKIWAIKSDFKALRLSDRRWYNVNEPVIPYLQKCSKGDEVTLTYEKKSNSTAMYVSKLVKSAAAEKTEAPTSTGKERSSSRGYDNPDRTAMIQRGNALNAAASVASSQQFINPETGEPDPQRAAEFTKILAIKFLGWLREE